jgi:hypothetical protein
MPTRLMLICASLSAVCAAQQFTVSPSVLNFSSGSSPTITLSGFSGSPGFSVTAQAYTPAHFTGWLTAQGPIPGGNQITVTADETKLPVPSNPPQPGVYGKFIGLISIQINPPAGPKKTVPVIFDRFPTVPEFRLHSRQTDVSRVVLNYQAGVAQTLAEVAVDYYITDQTTDQNPHSFSVMLPAQTASGKPWLVLADSNGQQIFASNSLTASTSLQITVDPNALIDSNGNPITSDVGLIALANQGGAIEVDLAVTLVPNIVSLSQTSAIAGGGPFVLTVNGTDFLSGALVYWNGSALPTTVSSSSQLAATVDPSRIATPGLVYIVVVNPGGAQSNVLSFAVTGVGPTITSLSPASVTAGSGPFLLTVNGNGFQSGASVQWNGSSLPTTFNSAAQVTASVPANLIAGAGTATVTVVNPGSTASNALSFSIIGTAPTITSLSPTSVTAGSGLFLLTVNGNGFQSGASVEWNGYALPTTFSSATQVTASVPANLIAGGGTATVTVMNPGGFVSNGVLFNVLLGPVSSGSRYVPIIPCRVADTTAANGAFGGPSLAAATTREFVIPNGRCGIPPGATAYAVNVTVVPHQGLTFFTLGPSGQPPPLSVSILNSFDGRIKSNAAIVPAGPDGGILVFATDTTDLLLDISGYFAPPGSPGSLAFYPLTPCRVADTRTVAGPLGGPSLAGLTVRSFPVLNGPCHVPASAQAYSLNLTAQPGAPLIFLVAWQTGQPLPPVSSLNAPTGALTANAAIVTAGTGGAINVETTSGTDFFMDINGYFAPPGPGGLSLYTLSPCRVFDTRRPMGAPPIQGTVAVNVAGSGCGAPSGAQAYVFNLTAAPIRSLEFISLWPDGQPWPGVSLLNAVDGSLTSNMAIVPTANGFIDLLATDLTHTFVDIFGYFAP